MRMESPRITAAPAATSMMTWGGDRPGPAPLPAMDQDQGPRRSTIRCSVPDVRISIPGSDDFDPGEVYAGSSMDDAYRNDAQVGYSSVYANYQGKS